MMYEPQEDSYLLQEQVKKYARGVVLDLGTGSGIQAITAAKKKNVKKVIAVDIQKSVIDWCKKQHNNKKITWLHSNLFSKIHSLSKKSHQKFDTIIFNPPYLPQDPGIADRRLYGGKKGYELIQRAFKDINKHLAKDGFILLLFSSCTQKDRVEDIITQAAMQYQEIGHQHISFEDLYVYKITKSELRKELETKHSLQKITYFTKGKRGMLYKARHCIDNRNCKTVIIKSKNPKSKAENRIENEAKWMKKLNNYAIGPKYLASGKTNSTSYVLYEYISGQFLTDWIEHQKVEKTKTKQKIEEIKKIKKILVNCFKQCRKLDLLGADKDEMHHPFKHILISHNRPVFLDFERMHHVKEPKNVTQFCQCLSHNTFNKLLRKKDISIDKEKIRDLAKAYKQDYQDISFNKIIDYLKTA